MIPVTLNRHTVKLSQNEAREVQKLYTAKQLGGLIHNNLLDWLNTSPNPETKERRKDAIRKFNLI